MADNLSEDSTGIASGLTQRLAEYASTLQFEDLSPDATTVARQCLLDWLGVAIAGADSETTIRIRDEALAEEAAPRATILGSEARTSAALAALVNGTAGHALDYDDVHLAMPGHPTVPIAPALLALAEREGSSGRELITAFVAGVEVECRVGLAVTWDHYRRGFHATGTLGTIGAAAACARLLRLNPEQTATALGIAATQASGLKSMFGTDCKPLHAGRAAMWGLQAASLAQRGFTSREDALECEQGFAATQSGAFDAEAALARLGETFQVRDTLFKFHAACYGTHATIDAVRSLRDAYSLQPEAVEQIEAWVPEENLHMCNIERPETGLEAKFSLRFTAAMALSGRNTSDIDAYNSALCAEPDLVALRERVRVTAGADVEDMSSRIAITLRNGEVLHGAHNSNVPATDLHEQGQRLEAKFRSLTTPIIGSEAANAIVSLVSGLETQPDLSPLFPRLSSDSA